MATKTPKKALRPRPRATTSLARATSRRPSVFPAHLHSTADEWRRVKRGEWLEVEFALQRYLYGAAYVPATTELDKLQRLALQVSEALKGDWTAW